MDFERIGALRIFASFVPTVVPTVTHKHPRLQVETQKEHV